MSKKLVKHDYTNPALTKELDQNERIIEYLSKGEDPAELSEADKRILDRYWFAYDLLSNKRSRHEVANKLRIKFQISRAQAYRDIFNMQYVIGTSLSIDEKFYEKVLIDSIMETIRMAAKKGDLRAKAQAERNLLMVLGFPKSEDSRITPDMLQQNILIITSNPKALGDLPEYSDEQIEKMVRNFKRKSKKKANFDEAEEVSDDEQ